VRRSSGLVVWDGGLELSYTGQRVRIPLRALMFVLVSLYVVLSRVGTGLATSWSLVQGDLPHVVTLIKKPLGWPCAPEGVIGDIHTYVHTVITVIIDWKDVMSKHSHMLYYYKMYWNYQRGSVQWRFFPCVYCLKLSVALVTDPVDERLVDCDHPSGVVDGERQWSVWRTCSIVAFLLQSLFQRVVLRVLCPHPGYYLSHGIRILDYPVPVQVDDWGCVVIGYLTPTCKNTSMNYWNEDLGEGSAIMRINGTLGMLWIL
jgi:hypothetical protein